MKIQKLMNSIQLSEKGIDLCNQFQLSEQEYLEWKNLFDSDIQAFLEKGNKTEGFEQMILYLYVRFAADRHEWYIQEGISEDIYFQTMKDISIWESDYEKRYEKPGVKADPWISFSLKGKLFRLGRLQFEPVYLERDIMIGEKTFSKGMKALNIHIPEDGKLSIEACEQSFMNAEEFFKTRGFAGENLYLCESWLLSPVLKKFLKKDSNILNFQNRFYVYDVIYPFRQAEERIFGEIRENIEDYQESTSLQVIFKQWLRMHPEDIGMGVGIFCYKNK